MANKQEELMQEFQKSAGAGAKAENVSELLRAVLPVSVERLPESLSEASKQIEALRSATTLQTQVLGSNTEALAQNTAAKSSGIAGTMSTIGKTASSVLGNSLGSLPLVSLFRGLFGGGQPKEPEPLIRYALPAPIHIETAERFSAADYGQTGLPRAVTPAGNSRWESRQGSLEGRQSSGAGAPQVTVQVQALDSRSFLDRKEDIARAVREAMLHMHSLNDVVSDL